jgi:hypothetical protein
MDKFSKTLKKTDDSAGRLIKNLLNGNNGYGIDIEIIFETKTGWVMIEFLKCENRKDVNACSSHPYNYWYKNYRKFIQLHKIALKLNAKLLLVNYEEHIENEYGNFRVMVVDVLNSKPSKDVKLIITDLAGHECCNFKKFQELYLKINNFK